MKRLRSFIESVFDEDYDRIVGIQNFRELEEWDSLKYVKLVVAMQAEFRIELTPDEIPKITSVAAIADMLKSKGVEL